MEKYCPMCEKNGIRRRVKAFQINLEEAMWSCEAEECCWPIGYEELTFFSRSAFSCNWEELNPAKEDVPAPMEFTLYTPPVTPASELSKELTELASAEYSSYATEDKIGTLPKYEFIISTKDSTDSNKSLFEPLELGDINCKESRNIMNEQIAGVRTLPKIVNIEKTNINFKIFPDIDKHCDNRKIQEDEHSLMDTNVMNTCKNLDISNSTEFDLSQQYNIASEQNESGKLQSEATISEVETNFGAETLSKTTNMLVDLDTINLNTSNQSTENISNSDIDTLLDDIFKNESHMSIELNDDWLNMLVS